MKLATPIDTGKVCNLTYALGRIDQNGTAYIDNKEYNTFNGDSTLTFFQRIYNTEGYSENFTAIAPNYNYYRRDHLGNNREVWLANTGETLQRMQSVTISGYHYTRNGIIIKIISLLYPKWYNFKNNHYICTR